MPARASRPDRRRVIDNTGVTEVFKNVMIPEMTPRERWLAILERRPPDRIPTDYTATPEVTARLLRELDCPDERAMWKKLHIDGRIDLAPKWKLPHHPDDPEADLWGVRYQQVLPFGTVDDVVAEVTESITIYQDARWICAPCHRLQPVTPTENILALYETIHSLG